MSNPQRPSSQGIDFRQALEILSSRPIHHHDHEEHHDAVACHDTAPPDGAEQMGQVIDLLSAATVDADAAGPEPPWANSTNEGGMITGRTDEEKARRRVELRQELQQLRPCELLQLVLSSQEERVATYKAYDRGLVTVLQTGNLTDYPQICMAATARFALVSDTINAAHAEWVARDDDPASSSSSSSTTQPAAAAAAVGALIATLQAHEQQKLQWTAAWHLESMRYANMDDDARGQALLGRSTAALERQLAAKIEQINDTLDELRTVMMELSVNCDT